MKSFIVVAIIVGSFGMIGCNKKHDTITGPALNCGLEINQRESPELCHKPLEPE